MRLLNVLIIFFDFIAFLTTEGVIIHFLPARILYCILLYLLVIFFLSKAQGYGLLGYRVIIKAWVRIVLVLFVGFMFLLHFNQ